MCGAVFVGGGGVSELPVPIGTPTLHRSGGEEGAGEIAASSDGNDSTCKSTDWRGHISVDIGAIADLSSDI